VNLLYRRAPVGVLALAHRAAPLPYRKSARVTTLL
jgi:hypothetical protein